MKNKFAYILVFIIIILIAIYCIQIIKLNNNKYNNAIDGKIDLNDKYLQEYNCVPLAGEWDFYPNEFLMCGDMLNQNSGVLKVELPGAWIDANKEEGKRGYGTYSLEFKNVEQKTDISMLFAIAPSEAYDVYIDNNMVLSVGEIGKTKQDVIPKYKSAIIDEQISDGSQMMIHASNLSYHSGGYIRPITVGYRYDIAKLKRNILIKDILVLGSLLLMMLAVLVMIFISKRNRLILLYFLIADIISICYVLSTGDILIQNIFPNIPFIVHYTMYYLMSISGGTVLILIIDRMYPDIGSRMVKYISIAKMVIFYLLFFLAKDYFVGPISNIKDILVLVEFLYCIAILSFGLINKKENTLLILVGVIVLLLCVLWDIMYAYSFIFTSFELIIPYGLIVFVLCFMITMVREFHSVYHKASEYETIISELKKNIQVSNELTPNVLKVNLLGSFEVYRQDGSKVKFRTKKTKELMAYLVHHRNVELSPDVIIGELFEDKEYDKAKQLLYTSYYYIKKELNTQDVIIFSKIYFLDKGFVVTDFGMLSSLMQKIKDKFDIKIFEEMMSLYKGGYLEIEAYSWASVAKAELEKKMLEFGDIALDYYIKHGKIKHQIDLCEKMILIDEYQESYYKHLIDIYKKTGQLEKLDLAQKKYDKIIKDLM